MSKVVIDPSVIAEGEPEKVSADMRKFNKAKEQVNLAVSELGKYAIIITKETCDEAMEVLKLGKKVDTAIESKRKQLVGPWNGEVSKINTFAKELVLPLNTAMDATKKAVLAFQEAEQKKAKEKMIADRKTVLESIGFVFDEGNNVYQRDGIGLMTAMEIEAYNDETFNMQIGMFNTKIIASTQKVVEEIKENSELDSIFSGDDETPVVEAPPAVIPQKVFSSSAPIVKGTTKRWTFEVTDPSLVPAAYLQVNEVAIRKAISEGVRDINGVRIFQDTSLTIRS